MRIVRPDRMQVLRSPGRARTDDDVDWCVAEIDRLRTIEEIGAAIVNAWKTEGDIDMMIHALDDYLSNNPRPGT